MKQETKQLTSWATEHRERQEHLFAALQAGHITEEAAEVLDAADNERQKILLDKFKLAWYTEGR